MAASQKPNNKGKNFQLEKERQLIQSVLAISHDPVSENP